MMHSLHSFIAIFTIYSGLYLADDQTQNETLKVEAQEIAINHKQIFEQQLTHHGLNVLYTKLDKNGLMDNDLILFLDEKEIDELCHDVKLNKVDIFKFKSIIRKMRHDNVIKISTIEQKAFHQITDHLLDTTEISNVLKTYTINDINDTAKKLDQEIDIKFEKIIQKLKSEKEGLHQKINQWKTQKIKILKSEAKDVDEYNGVLQHFKRDWIESIQKDLFITREERDRKIVENVTEIMNMYNSKFINKNEYIIDYTYTLSDIIKLNDNIQCTKHIDVETNKLSIPIFLDEPIVVDTVHSVYKLVLRWRIYDAENNECMMHDDLSKNQFKFMYKMETDAIWKELNIGEIDGCEVNINNLFKYEIVYQFRINYVSEYSIRYILESNVQRFVVSGIAKEIELEYVEHFGNHIDRYHHPKYLLKDENNKNYLYSSLINSSVVDHNWIIFRFKEKNRLYLPTKVYITNVNNEKGINMINIYIGDIELNEWILLEPNDIDINKSEDEQSFVIYAGQKSVIQRKQYQNIKLVMNNTKKTSGYVWYSFHEFAIDGIDIGKLEGIENDNLTQINETENKQRIVLNVDHEEDNGSYFTISGIATAIGGILLLLCFWNIFTEMNDKHNY